MIKTDLFTSLIEVNSNIKLANLENEKNLKNRRMSLKTTTIIGIVLAIVLLLIVYAIKSNTSEGFITYYGPRPSSYDKKLGYIGNYDHLINDEPAYHKLGRAKYNKFSDTFDVTRGNFIRSDNEDDIARTSRKIQDSMVTSDPSPSQYANTLLGLQSIQTDAELAPANGMMLETKKCEALRSRSSCAKLSDPNYSNCGVCIKGGTPYSYQNDGKHIGGLLLLPDDRQEALSGGKPLEPTVGECPAGMFFIDKDKCEREVNRQDCKEAGESGGFNGGTTLEGLDVIEKKCAQVPKNSEKTFIYEPKNRAFSISLRALAPIGTGVCKIFVYKQNEQIAYGENPNPGTMFVIDIPRVKEADQLTVIVALEFPYRKQGNSELFQVYSGYDETRETSELVCRRLGTSLATRTQMIQAIQNGAQLCSAGFGQDFVGYPGQARHKAGGCGDKGLNEWIWTDPSQTQRGASWCFGIKPPESTNKLMNKSIMPFFQGYKDSAIPSQKDQPDQWSQFGDYQAQYERAILLQWEMTNGTYRNAIRIVQFEPTIIELNDLQPTSVSSDGSRVFRTLRKFGTFENSSIIRPRKAEVIDPSSKMARNQFWMWSNQPLSQQIKFVVKVPGIFLDTYYEEDRSIGSMGPLVGKQETVNLLRTSPCLKEGQISGKYSLDCLQNLFISSGGDIANGKLVTKNGGLAQLNSKGDMNAIETYLADLYTLATTGKDSNGQKVGSNAKDHARLVNDASQLMFGFDISTPCEDISEDKFGNIVLSPKQGIKDADCLDWLWRNTGSEDDRFQNDGSRNIKNTYESIGQRFSGLKNGEGSKELRNEFPFQTCQRTGSISPIGINGSPNKAAIDLANSKGDISAIQRFYNGIFQLANNPTSKGSSKSQTYAVNQCYGVKKAVNPDFDLEGTWKDSKGNILMFRTLGSDEQSKHYLWHEGAVASNPLRLAYRLTSDTTGLFGLANDWAVLGRDRGMGPSDQFVIKTGNIEVSEYTFYVTDDNELTDKYETVWTRTSLSSGPKYIGCFRDSGGRQIPNYRGQTNSVGECAGIAERYNENVIGLQYGGQCFTGTNPRYDGIGPENDANNCGPLGGTWSNQVYKLS